MAHLSGENNVTMLNDQDSSIGATLEDTAASTIVIDSVEEFHNKRKIHSSDSNEETRSKILKCDNGTLKNAEPLMNENVYSEFGIKFSLRSNNSSLKLKKRLYNDRLNINRAIICCGLASFKKSISSATIKCLDGIAGCGIQGMLWLKHLNKNSDLEVTLNSPDSETCGVINNNLKSNGLSTRVTNEDPCVLLRKENFDFIYLNCNNNASYYFDSIFCNMRQSSLLAITVSEDPAFYWQAADNALRHYDSVIVKSYYQKELAIRVVIASMTKAAARYNKGLQVYCVVGFKSEQSFTIFASVVIGAKHALNSLEKVQRFFHCRICEEGKFLLKSESPESVKLECAFAEKGVYDVIGPLWSGIIFSSEFVTSMMENCKGYPWDKTAHSLLQIILEEARYFEKNSSDESKMQLIDEKSKNSVPCFYYNTHRHNIFPKNLLKVQKVIEILKKNGYRASRTHFDSEAIRTNAQFKDLKRIFQYTQNCSK